MGLNLLARLLHLLGQVLLEEGRGNWVLLSLSLSGRDGGGLRHGCGRWGRGGRQLDGFHRFLY